MKILNKIIEKYYKYENQNTREAINNSKSLPKEIKELVVDYIDDNETYYENKRIYRIKTPKELTDKLKKNKIEKGFSVGMDKNGFFIYTHRSGTKGVMNPNSISIADIKRINASG